MIMSGQYILIRAADSDTLAVLASACRMGAAPPMNSDPEIADNAVIPLASIDLFTDPKLDETRKLTRSRGVPVRC
jgi:hypothetical protein